MRAGCEFQQRCSQITLIAYRPPARSKGSVSRTRHEPSLGPPLETSCFKGSWKQTPYSGPAASKLRFKALKTYRKWRSTWLPPLNGLAVEVPKWHKPERVTVLLPGPYASGMTHPSLHGCTCGVSWKEYGRSHPAPRTVRLCKTTVKISGAYSCGYMLEKSFIAALFLFIEYTRTFASSRRTLRAECCRL